MAQDRQGSTGVDGEVMATRPDIERIEEYAWTGENYLVLFEDWEAVKAYVKALEARGGGGVMIKPRLDCITQVISDKGDAQRAAYIIEGEFNTHNLYIFAGDVRKLYERIEALEDELARQPAYWQQRTREILEEALERMRSQPKGE